MPAIHNQPAEKGIEFLLLYLRDNVVQDNQHICLGLHPTFILHFLYVLVGLLLLQLVHLFLLIHYIFHGRLAWQG